MKPSAQLFTVIQETLIHAILCGSQGVPTIRFSEFSYRDSQSFLTELI